MTNVQYIAGSAECSGYRKTRTFKDGSLGNSEANSESEYFANPISSSSRSVGPRALTAEIVLSLTPGRLRVKEIEEPLKKN